MIACVDVDYRDATGGGAVAACVLMHGWTDSKSTSEWTTTIAKVEPYVPGQFYKRELPCLLAVLASAPSLTAVVVDGYVWLGADENGAQKPGLGAHLHDALSRAVPVIGVAKTAFAGATDALPVLRGDSTSPLFVSAVGVSEQDAADRVRQMHGQFRVPTLLKRVDSLCRGKIVPELFS